MSKKQLTLIAAFSLALILALGFYVIKRKEQISTHNGSPTKVTVGHLPIADCAQLFVALDKGYFKEEGLEVDPLLMPSGVKIIEALATGNVDIGFSAVVPLILANERGLNIVALTGGPAEDKTHAEHAVLVRNDSPIKSPKDLKGKTIAILAFRSIDELFVKEWLQVNGVDASTVNMLEIPFPQMEAALQAKQVDAIAAIEPFVTAARLNGKSRILSYNYVEVQPLTEIGTYSARDVWIKNNTDVANRFRRSIYKATVYANAHPDEVRNIIIKYAKLNPELAKEMTLPLYTEKLTPENLNNVMQLALKWGIISSPIDVKRLLVEDSDSNAGQK